MAGHGSLEVWLWVFVYAAAAVSAASLPWWLHRGTRWATLWLGIGAAASASVVTAVLMFPWLSGDVWVALPALFLLYGSYWLAIIVGMSGTLLAVVGEARNTGPGAAVRRSVVPVVILTIAILPGILPVLGEVQLQQRADEVAQGFAGHGGVPLEDIESRLLQAGESSIAQALAETEPDNTALSAELVRLWQPLAKLALLGGESSRWNPFELAGILKDDDLILQAADEVALDAVGLWIDSDFAGVSEESTLTIIERRHETRERAEPNGLERLALSGSTRTAHPFDGYRFRRIVFKLSEGAEADADGYLVYHVYVGSPDGVDWYVVGLKCWARTP